MLDCHHGTLPAGSSKVQSPSTLSPPDTFLVRPHSKPPRPPCCCSVHSELHQPGCQGPTLTLQRWVDCSAPTSRSRLVMQRLALWLAPATLLTAALTDASWLTTWPKYLQQVPAAGCHQQLPPHTHEFVAFSCGTEAPT